MYKIKNSKHLASLINYTNLNNMISEAEMKEFLNCILNCHRDWEFITIQGETFGGSIQKRKYGDC